LISKRPKALVSWSSGKDGAWALHEVRRARDLEIIGGLTTVTEAVGRVSMHGVREELLRAQLDAAGLPPIVVYIPFPCSNEVYEQKMAAALDDARASGVAHMIFGDLFLSDVREYRERHLIGTGITPIFPVWGRETAALAREMIDSGVEARLSTMDLKKLAHLPVEGLTARCSPRCRPASILAGRTANFIPSYRRDPCSRAISPLRSGRRSSATDSLMPIYCRPSCSNAE
jgi:diphthamide synthase (EF-2-diphthine--ammonia ligase)